MEIREMILKNFGKFSNKSIQISSGIQVIYAENEGGKSTIHTFIRSMLFGLDRGRGRAAKRDTFKIYEPWENSNYYSGAMRFICGKKTFYLSRNFDKVSKQVSLICEEDGEVLSVEDGDLEMLLGRISLSNYENTISVAQHKIETGEELVVEVRNFAANFHSQGDDDIQLQNVTAHLKAKRKEVRGELDRAQNRVETNRERIILERDYIQREIDRLEAQLKENKQLELLSEAREVKEEKKREKVKIDLMTYITFAILLFLPLIIVAAPLNYMIVLVIALAEGLYIWNRLKYRMPSESIEEETEIDIQKVMWEQERLTNEIQEKYIVVENLEEELQELQINPDVYKNLTDKMAAMDLAMDRIGQVAKEIQKNFGHELNVHASAILESITRGKYQKLFVDEQLNVVIYAEGRSIGIEQVSRGTIEQVYFAIRMAVSEILHTENLPIILDDTLVYYDDMRASAILEWLHKTRRQVILFTCHKREMKLLEQLKIPYGLTMLSDE